MNPRAGNSATNRKKSARLPEKQKLETLSNQSGPPKIRSETEYSQNSRKSNGAGVGLRAGFDHQFGKEKADLELLKLYRMFQAQINISEFPYLKRLS
jgi:hypothetical protein